MREILQKQYKVNINIHDIQSHSGLKIQYNIKIFISIINVYYGHVGQDANENYENYFHK